MNLRRRFSGYEPHECPDYAKCPVCHSYPEHMIGQGNGIMSDEYVLMLMAEDGLIDASLVQLEARDLGNGRYGVGG